MNMRNIFAAAALMASTSVAFAAPVFSDNFDADTIGLNTTTFLGGWTVSDGTVDTIGVGSSWDLIPGNGHYIDLDGSTYRAGVFSNSVHLAAGTYTLSFDIAGNMRGAGSDTVDINFGTSSQTLVVGQSDALSTKTLSFTAAVDGQYTFSFHNHGGDNQGALLDNVSIAAVPEPETYAMLLAGLGALGFVARRRRQG